MAFIPVANTAEININHTLHGERIQNTLYAQRPAGWTLATLEELAGEMATWVESNLYTVLSSTIQLTEIAVRDLTTANSGIFVYSPPSTVVGDIASPGLPGNVAVCVSFRTGFAGRSYRGRNYVGSIPEADVAGNVYSAAQADTLQGIYGALLTPTGPMGATSSIWVVVSRYANKLARPEGIGTQVRSVQVDQFVDSQRRRLAGRGA